jgi:hypothetical protein
MLRTPDAGDRQITAKQAGKFFPERFRCIPSRRDIAEAQ